MVANVHRTHNDTLTDASVISDKLGEHTALNRLLQSKVRLLPDCDVDRWVGMGMDQDLVVGDTLQDVLQQLRESGATRRTFVVEFLSAQPVVMIL